MVEDEASGGFSKKMKGKWCHDLLNISFTLYFILFVHGINLQHELEMTIGGNRDAKQEHKWKIHEGDGLFLN